MVEYPWKSKSCRNLRFKILPPPNMWLRESSPMLSQSWRHHTYYVLLQSCNFLSVCYPRHDQGRVLVYQNSVPSIGNGNWRCTHRSFMERKEREEWEEEREKNLLWLSFVGVRWFYTMALIWQLGESPLRGVVKWIACGWLSTRGRRRAREETVGWQHWRDRHEFEQAPGIGDGQGGLACCSPWGRRVRHDWVTALNWSSTRISAVSCSNLRIV